MTSTTLESVVDIDGVTMHRVACPGCRGEWLYAGEQLAEGQAATHQAGCENAPPQSTTSAGAHDRFEPIWLEPLTLTPIVCQPWCVDGEGHQDSSMVEDKWCRGRERRLQPSREERLISDTTRGPDYLTVYPVKFFGEESAVFLGRGEDSGVKLCPDEAETLARQLLAVAGQIRDAARAGASK